MTSGISVGVGVGLTFKAGDGLPAGFTVTGSAFFEPQDASISTVNTAIIKTVPRITAVFFIALSPESQKIGDRMSPAFDFILVAIELQLNKSE
jgi:hypothetical protein